MSNKKKLIKIAMLFSIMLISIVLSSGTIKKYTVKIIDNKSNEVQAIFTNSENASEILEEAQITLDKHDRAFFSNFINDSATLRIERAINVPLIVKDKTKIVTVNRKSVQDVLKQEKVKYDSNDIITPALNSIVDEGTKIKVVDVKIKTVKVKETIPYTKNIIYSPSKRQGEQTVLASGENGKKEVTKKVVYHNGKKVSTKIVKTKVLKKATSSKVLVGDKSKSASVLKPPASLKLDKNGNPTKYKYKVSGKATAYSSRGRPTKLVPGNVAMNLSKFPRGTKLYIKTKDGSFIYGYSEVRDTGTALVTGHCLVDLFFSTYNESRYFGAKNVDIYVLE